MFETFSIIFAWIWSCVISLQKKIQWIRITTIPSHFLVAYLSFPSHMNGSCSSAALCYSCRSFTYMRFCCWLAACMASAWLNKCSSCFTLGEMTYYNVSAAITTTTTTTFICCVYMCNCIYTRMYPFDWLLSFSYTPKHIQSMYTSYKYAIYLLSSVRLFTELICINLSRNINYVKSQIEVDQ